VAVLATPPRRPTWSFVPTHRPQGHGETSAYEPERCVRSFRVHLPFRRRLLGASIRDAGSSSLQRVPTVLDADTVRDRSLLLGATSKALGATREAVIEAAVRRIAIWRASKANLTERDETSPRWVCDVLGLTRLSQRTSWRDGRFGLDRGASRLLATVN